MNENENTVKGAIVVIAAVAMVGVAVRDILKIRREEQRKRQLIQVHLDNDLLTIAGASYKIEERLKSGYYNGWSLQEIMNDLNTEIEFGFITTRLEQ